MKKTVIAVRETVKLSPRAELERWKIVEYMLDDFGPFVFEIKKDEFTWDKLKEDMAREESGLKSATG